MKQIMAHQKTTVMTSRTWNTKSPVYMTHKKGTLWCNDKQTAKHISLSLHTLQNCTFVAMASRIQYSEPQVLKFTHLAKTHICCNDKYTELRSSNFHNILKRQIVFQFETQILEFTWLARKARLLQQWVKLETQILKLQERHICCSDK